MSARGRIDGPALAASGKRVAVYTRKSTSAGLEQDFNSLDAQREACENYARSQAHLGWKLAAERYSPPIALAFSPGRTVREAT